MLANAIQGGGFFYSKRHQDSKASYRYSFVDRGCGRLKRLWTGSHIFELAELTYSSEPLDPEGHKTYSSTETCTKSPEVR